MSTLLTAVGGAPRADSDGGRSPGCDRISAEERIRSRELAQYFEAASIIPGKKNADGLGASEDIDTPARLAQDPTLTSLCQLGTLKLQTARAFISIIDRSHQYIISEATPSVSLRDSTIHADGDGLFLGVRVLDLSYGVCPHTIQVFTKTPPDVIAVDNEVILASRDFYMIRDFQKHPDLGDRPYVTGEPYMRSYLEVPLASDRGFVIGSYCVVDNKPRSFDQSEIAVLTEIAGSIVQHLDLLRANVDLQRTRALVQGLGMYVDGYSSLTEQQPIVSPAQETADDQLTIATGQSGAHEGPHTPASEATVEVIPRPEMDGPRRLSEYGSNASQEIRDAFSRASNLILQSMDAGGVAFLDAVDCDHNRPQSDTAKLRQCQTLSFAIDPAVPNGVPVSATFNVGEGLLQRLLAAYPVGHVFSSDEFGIVPGGVVNRDARSMNHPSRHTFRSKYPSEVAEDPRDMAELLAAIPGAGSVLFLPLWSFRKEKWYAAAVCWTSDATRVFAAEDLHYLSAFGNSIMAEVARIEAAAVSSAKSDFISSISHELKSPLHGILAGVDLLREATGPALDSASLSAVSSCGMMLLDTVNHLLDFAKINFLNMPSSSTGRNNGIAGTKLSSINIATVVQDVVEGLHLAHSKRHLYGEDPHTNTIGISPAPARDLSPGCTPAGKSPEDVVILVDIDSAMDWNFRTEIGAWKRCTMNILGNALKFTETGSISIRLYTADLPHKDSWDSRSAKHVCLEIQDTGRGMSKEFIAGGLFTPFVQENTLSVGTGLGLSIVQQLAKGLGGRVEVESEQGVGTKFTVLIPFGDACSPLSLETENFGHTALDPDDQLRAKHIYMPPSAGEDGPGVVRTKMVRRLLAETCSSWLGMTVSTSNLIQVKDGDFVVRQVVGPQGNLDHLWTVEVVDGSKKGPTKSSPMFPQDHVSPLAQPFTPRLVASALLQALQPQAALNTAAQLLNGHGRKRGASQDGQRSPAKLRKLSICATGDIDTEQPTLHLLLVDDNDVNLKVLAMAVEKVGCTVTTARNGQEAVEAVINNHNTPGNRHFDWIFMDMSMPVMDGSTATRKIRSWEREAEVSSPSKVVALTALSGSGAQDGAISSGCDMFLSKPVSIQKVRQLLREGRVGGECVT